MQPSGTRLKGKVAIVTGAGTLSEVDGVGQATAILFARQGAQVLLVDKVEANALKTLATIEAEDGVGSVFCGDVSISQYCRAMVRAAVERYGALHILVNNAAISCPGSAVDVEESAWDKVIAVDLKGPMLASKYAIPAMLEVGGGSIINISSIEGLRGASTSTSVAYGASKGGIDSLTRHMAVDHGRGNIRVNSIAPGHLYASATRNLSDQLRDLRRRAGPLGTEGTAWDVAWAAVFLASDESRWISGVVLPVDAGLLATTPLAMLRHLRKEPVPS